MRYLIVVRITEGRFNKQYTFEKESFDEVIKSISEFPYNWKLEKVYEIANEVELEILK